MDWIKEKKKGISNWMEKDIVEYDLNGVGSGGSIEFKGIQVWILRFIERLKKRD
jgi:hypothetical protein